MCVREVQLVQNRIAKYPFILGLVALVAGLLLALVYNVTLPIIEKNREEREIATVKQLFSEDVLLKDVSETLGEEEKEAGLTGVIKAIEYGKKYYVYKITFADAFDGDESSCAVVLDEDNRISKFKFVDSADDWSDRYAEKNYIDGLIGETRLGDNDIVSGASKTGESFVRAVNFAISHQRGLLE